MTDPAVSLTAQELRALADAVEQFEKIIDGLQKIEAWPKDATMHIESEVQPGYLGFIGYDEGGSIAFTPALTQEKTKNEDD